MRITIVGTGYVGLVTGTCFAETGNTVTCVDIDKTKVEKLRRGEVTIYEPGLDLLLERNIRQKRISFTTHLAEGIEHADVIFLALPTPPGEDGSADLSYVLNVADELGGLLKKYVIIVDKSTVPVGTAEKVRERVARHARVPFDVVSNPEFLREGMAVDDFMKPERVVVGTSSDKAKKIMQELFMPYVRQGNPILFMDERSAELTKYAANAFLATKITFMNEIANMCEVLGANVDDVRKGVGTDSRIGKRFLFAGIGFGGSCFPKDVKALGKMANEVGYDFRILQAVMDVNDAQRVRMVGRMMKYFKGSLKGRTVAMWGLSFKPQTDDIREAPSLYNIELLLSEGARVQAHDPEAMENVRRVLGDKISYFDDPYAAAANADALFIATEWPEFRSPDFSKLGEAMKQKVIFDGRNVYDAALVGEHGFDYFSIGR